LFLFTADTIVNNSEKRHNKHIWFGYRHMNIYQSINHHKGSDHYMWFDFGTVRKARYIDILIRYIVPNYR
jgi:hypothetical protein